MSISCINYYSTYIPSDTTYMACGDLTNFRREVSLLKQLRHPRLTRLVGVTTLQGQYTGCTGIIMEYLSNGNLLEYLWDVRTWGDNEISRLILKRTLAKFTILVYLYQLYQFICSCIIVFVIFVLNFQTLEYLAVLFVCILNFEQKY